MKKLIFTLTPLLIVFAAASSALAAPRIFVSGFGSDTNAGTLANPVRQIQKAVSLVDPGGMITILNSANFNKVTINKPLTIVATGVQAEIAVATGLGISINTGPSETVVVRGLTINGLGGVFGIGVNTGTRVHVENCVVTGFTGGAGITSAEPASKLFVKDSFVRGNHSGISVNGGTASLDNVRLETNTNGLVVQNAKVSIANSVASGNTQAGLFTVSGAQLNIESCLVANNLTGIDVLGSPADASVARVSNCTVTSNASYGMRAASPSIIETRSNSTVRGNSPNTSGTITPITGN